ncbi:hypothetical protein [Streptomyces xiamenensis]|uniref:hypothetical protein n=1 Tax=Streptomyces xiamenensis TaxID=408015 RepID=UPI0035D5F4BD
MDLEGIGAIVAPVVALIAIPATIVAVRWQVKAALESAAATHAAGLAQAEATYSAALSAVRAEQEQWRRSLRRDAYATLLTALHRAAHTADDQATDVGRYRTHGAHHSADECAHAMNRAASETREALAVIELEGPEEVAAAALACVKEFSNWQHLVARSAMHEEGMRLLEDLRASESSASAGEPTPATDALAALASCGALYREFRADTSRGAEWQSAMETMMDALAQCAGLRTDHRLALLGQVYLPRGVASYGAHVLTLLSDARMAFSRSRKEFLAAAHHALDTGTTSGGPPPL